MTLPSINNTIASNRNFLCVSKSNPDLIKCRRAVVGCPHLCTIKTRSLGRISLCFPNVALNLCITPAKKQVLQYLSFERNTTIGVSSLHLLHFENLQRLGYVKRHLH